MMEEATSQILAELLTLFPACVNEHSLKQAAGKADSIRALLASASPLSEADRRQLVRLFENVSFRCPDLALSELYAQLARELGIQTQAPKVSRYLRKEQLPSLPQFVASLAKQEYPPGPGICHVLPSQILTELEFCFAVHGGCVPSAALLRLWFPKLLVYTNNLHRYLHYGNTMLATYDKLFIAILAASCHGCKYLLLRLTGQFTRAGGNREWIEHGLDRAPSKFTPMARLARQLAMQPWSLGKNGLLQLIINQGQFSKQQVLQAVVIICYYLAQSSFCMSMGLIPESEDGLDDRPFSSKDSEGGSTVQSASEQVRQEILEEPQGAMMHKVVCEPTERECLLAIKLKEKSLCEFLPERKGSGASLGKAESCLSGEEVVQGWQKEFKRFLVGIARVDQGEEIVRAEDWNFKENTLALLMHFLPRLGEKVSDMLLETKQMTNMTVGNTSGVNTGHFRRAIRYYHQQCCGYLHEYFNYESVPELLGPELMQFVEVAGNRPDLLGSRALAGLPGGLSGLDLVHIGLLVSESRFQLALNLACRALSDAMFI